MNEVTQIHLGRQAYTIANDAHSALRAYLTAIEKAVGDKEVIDEVEARMVELLAEHGVNSQKVILLKDVDFLKKQLGSPRDFSGEEPDEATIETGPKRLFRDTDNAILGGVAAGIANFFSIETVLVRIIFILLTIVSFGAAIVVYIILWLAVPPARTVSEKLQMRGQSVTLGALKDSVSNSNFSATAKRMNSGVVKVLNAIFKFVLRLAGAGFIVVGTAILMALIAAKTYMLAHGGKLFQENLFPVGFHEQLLVVIAMVSVAIVAIFLILIGVTAIKRKWPLYTWLTAVLIGLFLVGATVSAALTADAVPHVQQRYQSLMHTTAISPIQPFNKIVTKGDVDIAYISSPTYGVNVNYSDHPDLSKLKVTVANNTLYVDSTKLDRVNHCNMLCLFPRYNMTVDIYAPNIQQFVTPPHTDIFYPKVVPAPLAVPVRP